MPEPRLWVCATADPEVLDLVHTELERLWADAPDVSDRDRLRFEMGLVEIVGNVVEHAYRADSGDPARQLRLEVTVSPTEVRGELGDNGQPVALDLGEVTMPGDEAESGRGLALALASLDRLTHERVDGRNRWTLVCERADS